MNNDLYVVLGATGEVGSRVAALLSAEGRRMLLVGRRETALRDLAGRLYGSVTAHVVDVTTERPSDFWNTISSLSFDRLRIVETIIDKTSSRNIRKSLTFAASFVNQLSRDATVSGHSVWVVTANSIAAHARWPYTTTYSSAKQDQVIA